MSTPGVAGLLRLGRRALNQRGRVMVAGLVAMSTAVPTPVYQQVAPPTNAPAPVVPKKVPVKDLATVYPKPLTPPASARGPAPAPVLPAWEQSWTPFSHTVAADKGGQQVQLFAGPVFRPGGPGGSWQAAAPTVTPGGAAGAQVSAAQTLFPVHLRHAAGTPVTLDLPRGPVTISIPQLSGAATTAPGGATYRNAATSTDLTARVTGDGVELDVARQGGGASATLTLHVDDPAHQLGTAGIDATGGVTFPTAVDGATVRLRVALQTPAGAGLPASANLAGAPLQLTSGGSGTDVQVTAPVPAGASVGAPSVLVATLATTLAGDPAAGTVTLAGDGCVSGCAFGTGDTLAAVARPGGVDGAEVQRGVLRFDTSAIPSGAAVDGASLTAHVATCLGAHCGTGMPVELHEVDGAWGSATGTDGLASLPAGGAVASQTVTGSAGRATWDVTAEVQRWVDGAAANHGLSLQLADETGALQGGVVFAGPGAVDPTTVPELDVTYHVPTSTETPPAPAPAAAVGVTAGAASALVTWQVPPATPSADPVASALVTLQDVDGGTAQTIVSQDTSAWFSGLVPGHHVTASVALQSRRAQSPATASAVTVVPATTPAGLTPSAPSGVAVSAGTQAWHVVWGAPASWPPVSRYDVAAYDASGVRVATAAVCGSCLATTLRGVPATAVAVGVTASTDFGGSSPQTRVTLPGGSSPSGSAAPAATPTPSPTPTASPAPAPSPTPPSGSSSSSAPAASPSGTPGAAPTGAPSATPAASPSPTPAAAPSNTSPPATSPSASTPTVPGAPGSVSAVPGNTTAAVTWTAASNGGATVTGYAAQAYTSGGQVTGAPVTVCGTCLGATVTGLANGHSYYVTVHATNSAGNGPSGQSPTFTLNAPPTVTLYQYASPVPTEYARGGEIGYGVIVFNPQTTAMSVSGVVDTLGPEYTPETAVTFNSKDFVNGPFCTSTSSPACGIAAGGGGTTLSVGSFTLAGGASDVFRFKTIVLGFERGCGASTTTATATDAYGQGSSSQAPYLCDAGLGTFPWFTTTTTATGPQGSASLTAGDGNVVVSQDDSTSVPLHGGLALGVHRAYNATADQYATGTGMLGSAWQITYDDGGVVAGVLTASGMSIPPDEDPAHPFAVTVVDASGGRTVFQLAALGTPVDVTALQSAKSTGPLAVTVPRALALDTGYNRLCVDQLAGPPIGVHASLWRYLEVTSSTGTCTRSTWTGSAILGYAVERTDRVRYEFASDGSKLDTEDANGNEIRAHYVNDPPSAGKLMGHMASVVEPATGRSLTFTNTPGTINELDISDAAHRVTRYYAPASSGLLTKVVNPDGSQLLYTYGGCTGASPTQLCSATSPLGAATSFSYAQQSSDGFHWPGPAHVAGITDRRGTATTVTVNAGHDTATVGLPGRNTLYSAFDPFDDAGEVDVVDPSTSKTVTQGFFFWDNTIGGTCRQPDAVPDHNLCSTVTQTLSGSEQSTGYSRFQYGAEGQLLSTSRCTVMGDWSSRNAGGSCSGATLTATAGTHSTHVDAGGTVATYDDLPAGSGQVSSPSGPGPGGARWLPTTLYALVDATQSLPAAGNVGGLSPSQWQAFLTTASVDDAVTWAPNQRAAAGVCATPGSPTGNSGDVCQTQGPAYDGVHPTLTQMRYTPTGETASKASPLAVSRNGGNPAPTVYTYYPDTAKDLSNTTSAGGWLEAVTDPTDGTGTGGFSVTAYDAAGNPARTWDQDATAGTSLSSYPGTIGSPASPGYKETLHASGAGAYSSPWRYAVSSRDQLGDLTTTTRDADGNALSVRPPRGNLAANSSLDVTQTFDAGDELLTTLTPDEAKANNAYDGESLTADEPTSSVYDARGNRTQVTDPAGAATVFTVDAANRNTVTAWSPGWAYNNPASPYYHASQPAAYAPNCTVLGAPSGPFPAGAVECLSTTTFDGTGHAVATTDGNGAQTQTAYDSLGRTTSHLVERSASPLTWERTDTVYDADGNVLRTCPPSSFANGTTSCATSTSPYDTAHTYDVHDRLSTTSTFRAVNGTTAAYTSSVGYDADGNPVSTTSPRGVTTTTTVNLLDRKVSQSFPRAGSTITTAWTYSMAGDILDVVDPSGDITASSFDAAHRTLDTVAGSNNMSASLAGVPTADGGWNVRTRNVYDADGHVVAAFRPTAFTASVTQPDQRYQVKTDYDQDGRKVNVWTAYYDLSQPNVGSNVPEALAQCPSGSSMFGNTTTGICVTRYRYDADGRVVSELLPTAAGSWSSPRHVDTAYTGDGRAASVQQPSPTGSGVATTYTFYDAAGRTVKTLDARGVPDVSAYSPDGLLVTHDAEPGVDYNNNTLWHCQTYAYDANGNKVADTTWMEAGGSADCAGTPSTQTWTYSSDNFTMSDTDAGGDVTTWTRDQVGNATTVTSPSANARDATNPAGTPTTNTYTEDNLLASTTQPVALDGSTLRRTAYAYAAFGSKSGQTVALVNSGGGVIASSGTQSYAYYPDHRLQLTSGRASEAVTQWYDPDGNVTNVTSPSGYVTASYWLNDWPRVIYEAPAGQSAQYYYNFDGSGNLVAPGTTGYTTANQHLYRGDAGQVTSMTDDHVGTFSWTYDADGRMLTQNDPNAGNHRSFTYNNDGTLQLVLYAESEYSGNSYSRFYDSLYRTTSDYLVGATPPQNGQYDVAQVTETFSYNGANRLTGFTHLYNDASTGRQDTLTFTATWDHDGNRLSWGSTASPADVLRTAAYNADDSVASEKTGVTQSQPGTTQAFSYTPSGATQTDGCRNYTYDGFDEMTSATAAANNPCGVSAATNEYYVYDGLHRMVSHTDGPYNLQTVVFHNGLTGNVAMERQVWQADAGNRDMYYSLDANGQVLAANVGFAPGGFNKLEIPSYDGGGNVQRVTNSAGTPLRSTFYDPFGAVLADVLPGQLSPESLGAVSLNAGYRGQSRDPGVGDYRLGQRDYDPSRGVFAQGDGFLDDPSGQSDLALAGGGVAGMRNLRSYANGDPVNSSDPSGHGPMCTKGPDCQDLQATFGSSGNGSLASIDAANHAPGYSGAPSQQAYGSATYKPGPRSSIAAHTAAQYFLSAQALARNRLEAVNAGDLDTAAAVSIVQTRGWIQQHMPQGGGFGSLLGGLKDTATDLVGGLYAGGTGFVKCETSSVGSFAANGASLGGYCMAQPVIAIAKNPVGTIEALGASSGCGTGDAGHCIGYVLPSVVAAIFSAGASSEADVSVLGADAVAVPAAADATATIPGRATSVLNEIDSTGAAPSGFRGGSQFLNDGRGGGQVLPQADSAGNPISYQEWDVNPYQQGVNRGGERVVTGSDGSAWYTDDHYGTFTPAR